MYTNNVYQKYWAAGPEKKKLLLIIVYFKSKKWIQTLKIKDSGHLDR